MWYSIDVNKKKIKFNVIETAKPLVTASTELKMAAWSSVFLFSQKTCHVRVTFRLRKVHVDFYDGLAERATARQRLQLRKHQICLLPPAAPTPAPSTAAGLTDAEIGRLLPGRPGNAVTWYGAYFLTLGANGVYSTYRESVGATLQRGTRNLSKC